MKLSYITDEATQSFSDAVAFAGEQGFSGVELRSVEQMSIDKVPISTLRVWKKELDLKGLVVPCIAGSFYKCGIDDIMNSNTQIDKLQRLCDVADELDCSYIRGFAFFRPEEGCLGADALAPLFEPAVQLLRSRGKKLLLEADPSVNTTNHHLLAQLLQQLDADVFGAVYDPGNSLYDPYGECPYPDGYEAVSKYLAHVHVKDAVYGEDGKPVCVAPGQGLVGWPLILNRLLEDGYDGWLSLETHYRKNIVLTEEMMRLPQGQEFTQGGMAATAESAKALRELIRKAGGEIL